MQTTEACVKEVTVTDRRTDRRTSVSVYIRTWISLLIIGLHCITNFLCKQRTRQRRLYTDSVTDRQTDRQTDEHQSPPDIITDRLLRQRQLSPVQTQRQTLGRGVRVGWPGGGAAQSVVISKRYIVFKKKFRTVCLRGTP